MSDLPLSPAAAGRTYGLADRVISSLDEALRTLAGAHRASRPYPAADIPETVVDPAEKGRIASLMRVNHAGEIAAQALYQGQALVAADPAIRASLLAAGREETDHLAWCATRIHELGGRRSLLDPVWYAGSFAIGAMAGLAGDRTSLGFVAETERQVGEHLEGHLQQLPQGDARTRAIIQQMSSDEARHGHDAMLAGGAVLPTLVRAMMKYTARIMTRTASWL
jgi:ubiquinone biosynthesis monooxygenase Coq7